MSWLCKSLYFISYSLDPKGTEATNCYFIQHTTLGHCSVTFFWKGGGFKYNLDKSTMHPKFDLTGVRTHDLWFINSSLHVPERLNLTTEPADWIY